MTNLYIIAIDTTVRSSDYMATHFTSHLGHLGANILHKINYSCTSYVYWNVRHLDSWLKRNQLDVTCFIISLYNAQHVLDVNTSILRSLRLMCLSLHTDTTPPQPYHNVTPTQIEPDQCNPRNNSTHKSQAPEDGCIDIRNMLSIK